MAYLGRQPVIGNFVKLDAITAVNGQAAYTMQNGSVNFTDYSTVNQFLVSLNGTIQSPGSSFTVSGSTLTFASNLSTGDVIDFIIVFGNSLSAGTPTDGSVSLAKLSATGTKDATTFLRGDNTFAAAGSPSIDDNGDATAITIDSSEQVGIGTTSPAFKLEVNKGSAGDIARFTDGVNANTVIKTSGSVTTFGPDTNNSLAFQQNDTERMRIDTSGRLLVGTTSPYSSGNQSSIHINVDGVGTGAGAIMSECASTSLTFHQHYRNGNGGVGGIGTTGSSTQFTTSSDYRLKENVVEMTNATDRLKQLQPKRFNFIADADTTVDGFLAHEVSNIVPEAITGEKDEIETYTDDDGNEQTRPVYQGIDQSKLVPLLVKTIQELEARITELENN